MQSYGDARHVKTSATRPASRDWLCSPIPTYPNHCAVLIGNALAQGESWGVPLPRQAVGTGDGVARGGYPHLDAIPRFSLRGGDHDPRKIAVTRAARPGGAPGTTGKIDFARINTAALAALPTLCARWLPDGCR